MKKEFTFKKIIAIIGLAAVIIPSSYAILKSSANSNKTLDTAKWNISLNQNNVNNYLSIIPDPNGTTTSYTLNITSDSEVDAIYSVVIDDLPSGVSASIDNGQFVPAVNNKIIFADVGTILYNDTNKTKTHYITFKAGNTAQYVNNKEVNVNVIARQTIPN